MEEKKNSIAMRGKGKYEIRNVGAWRLQPKSDQHSIGSFSTGVTEDDLRK
jgi:hypothetical protein